MRKGKIGLHRVIIVKRVRDLHDAYGRIGEETHRAHEKIALHDEVGIEQRKIFGVRPRQCVIDIAGLCVRVVGAGDVPHTLRLTKFLQPGPASVIENPHMEIRVVEAKSADDGLFQDIELLVVRRDVDVDPRMALGRHRPQPRLMDVRLSAPVALA